jgi:L-asparaginase II
MSYVVLAEVVRSGFVESEHRGVAVGLDASGAILVAAGDPTRPIMPRSANKLLQAVGMLRAGLVVDGSLLALAAASHSGERYHTDGVERILAAAGLDVGALQNTPDLPLGEPERAAWQAAGRPATSLAQNCSGKHAAMLATCVENGWSLEDYRAPDHPLQALLRDTLEDLAGEPVAATGVDGCGAPVLGISAAGLARAFARLATAEPHTAEGRVADAVRRHPEWVGGTGREVTRLIRAVPGMIAKDGAEAVFAAALPDGRAVAVKIADGGARAVVPVVVGVLRRLGVDSEVLGALADVPVLGHGRPVGTVRFALGNDD